MGEDAAKRHGAQDAGHRFELSQRANGHDKKEDSKA